MADSTLTSLELGKHSQYDDHLGTQIPLDITDIPRLNEDDLKTGTLDTAAAVQTQILQSEFPQNEAHDEASTGIKPLPPRSEDSIEIERFDPGIGDTLANTNIEPESHATLGYGPDAIIEQEDLVSDVGILDTNAETQVIDLYKPDRVQDAMDAEDDSDLPVKTGESDAPFVLTDIGGDNVELSDSHQREVQEMPLTQMRSSRRTTDNHSSEISSSARGHGSGKITGAGGIFSGFRGQAPRFSNPTDIDDDDSDVSDEGAR